MLTSFSSYEEPSTCGEIHTKEQVAGGSSFRSARHHQTGSQSGCAGREGDFCRPTSSPARAVSVPRSRLWPRWAGVAVAAVLWS